MSGEYQLIPARNGTATFVPRGHTILIRNTYGKQVIDTWAFALNAPPKKKRNQEKPEAKPTKETKKETKKEEKPVKNEKTDSKDPEEEKQEEVKEKVESQLASVDEESKDESKDDKNKEQEKTEGKDESNKNEQAKPAGKATWSSYLPAFRSRASAKNTTKQSEEDNEEQTKQANTRTWLSYLPSGKAYTSYLPSGEAMVSAFSASHYRDPDKSIAEQIYDFSKTPVGAAGVSYATGSGTAGTLYAAYKAYEAHTHEDTPPLEYMSMSQTRTRTKHISPKVGDILFSNLGQPLLTLIEDTTPGVHDTLVAACNPYRYRDLGVEKWGEHGSCAENLVLALKEINQKSGLKGARAVGAEVTVNSVPDPLNLFMNAPLDNGELDFKEPVGKKNEFVKFRAEQDVVVVMSACPMDLTPINGYKCMVAHFMVETDKTQQPSQTRRGSGQPPRKLNRNRSSQGPTPVQSRSVSFQSDVSGVSTPRRKPKKLEIRNKEQ